MGYDLTKQNFPLANQTHDGWSTETEATATCFCGAVQLAFPTQGDGLVTTFVCNCSDCHKISSSMFCSNFIVKDSHLKHLRGQENLTAFAQKKTPASLKLMTNYFCKTCGTLLYRVGESWPEQSILRIGTVDDFTLMETKLKPQVEFFTEGRAGWLCAVDGAKQLKGMGN
ncbi:uncharacterized protein BDZ99DRAFT_441126 [Mytilinidion resinicola]|uniref:CENP-V/GFA domain-containing protein n=1 Tax=Mytilinidion resinicola TaxID=574789 RepID=A0A6A6YNY8_9PEZI|nr:uncharacterized protein BDZ99DRAFT_441126 [Mytilinidion resinicola]KAF2810592.1 hypothetical protein BDZ99DRAFT_441126 [Mytilinidion resinicola]